MKEEKEIKRKKKSKKKKDFPQEKNEALDKVQHNHSIFPDPNAISCSIISPSTEIEIAEKASEHGRGSAQPNILEPNNFIESDTNKADASQSAKQDEVQTIVNNIPDNENRKESHDTTETVSNAGTLCTDDEASSILENECNNMSSAIVRQANGYSNCQKSILSDVTHIENTSIYFPSDFSRDASINHLKICLESELKSSQLLRLQISTLEELIVIRDADEARTKTQVERLRTENDCLEKEVLELKDMVKMLMLDRSKVLAKMVILQNGDRVDEVDASVDGSPIYQQIDDSTPDCTKEGSVFPSTSSTLAVKAVSEPSIQTTVTATIVDNLVPETVKLIPQEKQYDTSAASQVSDVCLAKHKPAGIFSTVKSQRDEAALIVPSEPVSVTLDSDKVNNQAGNLTWSAGSRKELERKEAIEIKDIERSNSSVEIESIIESEENNDTTKETYLAPSNELLGKSSSSDNYQHPNLPKVKFSDAPLIGAPFRLVSFMTRFVSGADLAAKSDR